MFSDPHAAESIRQGYIPVRVLDRQREEGRNPPDVAALQTRYRVQAFPTLVVVRPDGSEATRIEGYAGRQATLARLGQAAIRVRIGTTTRRGADSSGAAGGASGPR